MMYLFFKQGNLHQIAQLNYLDMVSAITAGACHDYAHDGYNNSYHINFMTDRALRFHDIAVQENWHASKSIKILLEPEFYFLENFTAEEKKYARKRIVNMILATDMA